MKSFLMLVLLVTIQLALPIEAALVVVFGNGLCMACCAVPQVLVWRRQLCPDSFISWDVVDFPVVAQRLVFMALTVQSDHRVSPIVLRPGCAGPAGSGAVGEETVAIPQLHLVFLLGLSFTCPSL